MPVADFATDTDSMNIFTLISSFLYFRFYERGYIASQSRH
jgi:hypothetical protein